MINKLWPDWKVIEEINNNSLIKIFILQKENEYSIVKIINFEKSELNIKNYINSGLIEKQEEFEEYYHKQLNKIKSNLKILDKFKERPYLQKYYDYYEVAKPNNMGIEFYIRMEYVKPLEQNMELKQIVKMFIDITNFLEILGNNFININIKNIYVGLDKCYKLDILNLEAKEELYFISPEQYFKKELSIKSSIYSLGLIVYYLISNLTLYKTNLISFEDRMNGKKIEEINNLDINLMKILLKCTQFNVEDRYDNISELKKDLLDLNVLKSTKKVIIESDINYNENNGSETKKEIEKPKIKKINKKYLIIILLLIFLSIFIYCIIFMNKKCDIGYINKNGKCVKGYYYCEEGYFLSDKNQCKKVIYSEPAKINYSCNEGYTLTEKGCVNKNIKDAVLKNDCPNGYELDNNKCEKIEWFYSNNNICPSNYVLKEGKCYIKIVSEPIQNYKCEKGYILSGNKCYVDDIQTPSIKYICSKIYKLKGKDCVKYDIKLAKPFYEE